jgi:RNA polymerase sigma-70 factor (ECF subfamily)
MTALPRESELIRLAAGGDQQAWAALLTAHRARLRRIVALRLDRRLRGRVDPSDVIREAYVNATSGLPRIRGAGRHAVLPLAALARGDEAK